VETQQEDEIQEEDQNEAEELNGRSSYGNETQEEDEDKPQLQTDNYNQIEEYIYNGVTDK